MATTDPSSMASAGAGSAPEAPAKIDLTAFCHPETVHEALMAPFAGGAYSYATDGRMFVRVPRRDGDPEQAGYAARLDTYLTEPAGQFAPFPAVDLPPLPAYVPKPCKACGATGRICATPCRKCRGTGMVECPTCRNEDDCESCNSSGTIDRPATTEDDPVLVFDCEDCDGTGDLGDPDEVPLVPTRVGPYSIDRRYVVLMQALPGIEIDLGRDDWSVGAPCQVGNVRPVRFRFTGGEGAIVPLHNPAPAKTEAPRDMASAGAERAPEAQGKAP